MATLRNRRQFPAVFDDVITYAGVLDVSNAATGNGTFGTASVTIKGAALGDFVLVSATTALTNGTALVGHVSAADTVIVALLNNSAAGVDQASTIRYNVVVLKPAGTAFFIECP